MGGLRVIRAQTAPFRAKSDDGFGKAELYSHTELVCFTLSQKNKMNEYLQNAAAMPTPLSKGFSTYSWQWHSNGMIHFSLTHFELVRILNNY